MAMTVKQLEQAIRLLRESEKREILQALVADLDAGQDIDVERAWIEEAQRRLHSLRTGKTKAIPSEQVFLKARHRLKDEG